MEPVPVLFVYLPPGSHAAAVEFTQEVLVVLLQVLEFEAPGVVLYVCSP